MQVITPITINDDNMTSSIAEPDPNVGEEEWELSDSGIDVSGEASNVLSDIFRDSSTGNYYALSYPDSGASHLYGYDSSGVYDSIDVNLSNKQRGVVVNGNIFCAGVFGSVEEYNFSGVLQTSYAIAEVTNLSGICFDGTYYYLLDSSDSTIYRYDSSFFLHWVFRFLHLIAKTLFIVMALGCIMKVDIFIFQVE